VRFSSALPRPEPLTTHKGLSRLRVAAVTPRCADAGFSATATFPPCSQGNTTYGAAGQISFMDLQRLGETPGKSPGRKKSLYPSYLPAHRHGNRCLGRAHPLRRRDLTVARLGGRPGFRVVIGWRGRAPTTHWKPRETGELSGCFAPLSAPDAHAGAEPRCWIPTIGPLSLSPGTVV
jgi:hypothetical protein